MSWWKSVRHRTVGTLRGRLTLLLVSVVLLACVVTGILTTVFLRDFLVDRLDTQLTSAGGRFSASLEHGNPGRGNLAPGGSDADADNAVPGQAAGTLGVRLVNGAAIQAAVVGSDGKNSTPSLDARDTRALTALPIGGGAHNVELHDVGDYRVRATAGRGGDVQVTGLPLRPVHDIVNQLIVVELGLFVTVVVACGFVTALSVRRTLRPLRRVTATAQHICDLPLADAGTPLPTTLIPARPTTEVDQVGVAVNHMIDHIRVTLAARDATEQQLRRFVADASHELRTPLATIRAYAEFATRTDAQIPTQTAHSLARIDTAARRMGTLVDDLLLLARLDAGRPLAREDVDLTRLVLDAVTDARTAGADHQWQLALPVDPVTVVGDTERIHQVIANLLANARVHTPAGTTVTASLTTVDGQAKVTVHDDGPGIAHDQLPDLFDRFTRGDASRSSSHGSTGLGLAIAHGITTAHGGTLTVQSIPGRTAFVLRLPVVRQPE